MDEVNPLTWIREATGINQSKLAKELGITEATVSRIESGKSGIGGKVAVRLWGRYERQLRGKGFSLVELIGWGTGNTSYGYRNDRTGTT